MNLKHFSLFTVSIMIIGCSLSCKAIDRSTVSDYNLETSASTDSSSSSGTCFSLSGAVDENICQLEELIVQKTNEFRQKYGKPALIHNKALSYAARTATLTNRSLSSAHNGFSSQRTYTLRQCDSAANSDSKLVRTLTAENWAPHRDTGNLDSVATAIVNMWINSSGHRRNMLSSQYYGDHKYIGVGVSKSGSQYYAIQIFGL